MFGKRKQDAAASPPRKKKSATREWVEMVLILAVFAVFVRMFMFQIPSGSMENTLLVGDYIFVNRFLYGLQVPLTDIQLQEFRDPKFGDVVVFRYPPDPSKNYIKRVIGSPGDTLEIRARDVYVNGDKVPDDFAKHIQIVAHPPQYKDSRVTPRGAGNMHHFGPIVVPEGEYFVMGDNRDNSEDSRVWGFVPQDFIKGRAIFIYWSWNREQFLFGLPRVTRIGRVVH